MMSIPKLSAIRDILFDEGKCYEYIISNNILYKEIICKDCGGYMKRYVERKVFRCTTKKCRKEVSIFTHSFFYKNMIKPNQVFHLGNNDFNTRVFVD
jgi:hypothetical protein